MITGDKFKEMALSFPGTEHKPHFERTGFGITGKRMFATYLPKDNTANIFLTPVEQSVFCQVQPDCIYPVPNKWGLKGATTFVLSKVSKKLVMEALQAAYNSVDKGKSSHNS